MKIEELPAKISIFPLSNVIFFPKTILPLNIFEKRYLQMVNDSVKKDRYFGVIQPKPKGIRNQKKPVLFSVGCLGKIVNFNETDDGRLIINLSGIIRFNIEKEIDSKKMYREAMVNYKGFEKDLKITNQVGKNNDIKKISSKIKVLFNKKGYTINWKELEILNLQQLVDTLSMISPLSLEEKQSLIEARDLSERIKTLNDITDFYVLDKFNNKTIQ